MIYRLKSNDLQIKATISIETDLPLVLVTQRLQNKKLKKTICRVPKHIMRASYRQPVT